MKKVNLTREEKLIISLDQKGQLKSFTNLDFYKEKYSKRTISFPK
jgi:hypothetical protein